MNIICGLEIDKSWKSYFKRAISWLDLVLVSRCENQSCIEPSQGTEDTVCITLLGYFAYALYSLV